MLRKTPAGLCLLLFAAVIATSQTPQKQNRPLVVHALNRLTFGPRPGDVEAVMAEGLDHWLDRQLHPETIAENPALEAKLAPLDSLRMSTAEMAQHYPTKQMLKAMTTGRLSKPSDPELRYAIQSLIDRREENAGKALAPAQPFPGSFTEQLTALESLSGAEQMKALDELPDNVRRKLFDAAAPQLRRRIQLLNGPNRMPALDLTEAKLLRAVSSDRQLEEVLADFWFNHFNVNLDKGADKNLLTTYEREAIRPHVLGRFEDLLLATAQSPAMLFYLDNWESAGPGTAKSPRKQGLNENYGRELMELHTLGVDGGYTQQDVTEVARCFTGWTIRQPQQAGTFDFNPRLHDTGEKHVLGETIPAGGGMSDGVRVIEILAHHPATARFISRSLAVRFVSDNPPETLITKMAKTFTSTDGDLLEVMKTLVRSPEFRDPATFGSKVKSPLELIASAIRAVNGDIDYSQALSDQLRQLGEPLYRKMEPTGYSNSGADWLNSASLLARMNFSLALVQNKIRGVTTEPVHDGEPASIAEAILFAPPSSATLSAIQAGLDPGKPQAVQVAGLVLGSPEFQHR